MGNGTPNLQPRHKLGRRWHPEHLEPDPALREFSCPIMAKAPQQLAMSTPQLRAAVMAASNKGQAIEAFWKWASQHGINSEAGPEWWEKMQKLTAPRTPP
jgi:hypothetical protein